MKTDIRDSWKRLLNPETLRANLIVASLFITAFELLKNSIIERPRESFADGFDENGPIIIDNGNYKTKVLSLGDDPLDSSLKWLQEMDAIDDHDIAKFDAIKDCRNKLAHEMDKFISQGTKVNPLAQFPKIFELLDKIEKWWILGVEIPTNPKYDGQDIDEDEIVSGKIMLLRLLLDIAIGSEKESKYYYEEFLKRQNDNEQDTTTGSRGDLD